MPEAKPMNPEAKEHPMPQALPLTAQLSGTGWVSWEQVRQALAGAQCVWADLGGVHIGPVPDRPPTAATHLWGWQGDTLYRVRLDAGQAILATLDLSAALDSSETLDSSAKLGGPPPSADSAGAAGLGNRNLGHSNLGHSNLGHSNLGNRKEVPILAGQAATWAEPHVNVGPVAGMRWQTVETLSSAAMTFLRPAGPE